VSDGRAGEGKQKVQLGMDANTLHACGRAQSLSPPPPLTHTQQANAKAASYNPCAAHPSPTSPVPPPHIMMPLNGHLPAGVCQRPLSFMRHPSLYTPTGHQPAYTPLHNAPSPPLAPHMQDHNKAAPDTPYFPQTAAPLT
jgi:hypothetical protein